MAVARANHRIWGQPRRRACRVDHVIYHPANLKIRSVVGNQTIDRPADENGRPRFGVKVAANHARQK